MLLSKMWSNSYCLGQKMSHLWEELQPLDPNSRSVLAKVYYLTKNCFQPWAKALKQRGRTGPVLWAILQRCSVRASAPGILITKGVKSKCKAAEGPLKKKPMHRMGKENVNWYYQELLKRHPGHSDTFLQDSVLSNKQGFEILSNFSFCQP